MRCAAILLILTLAYGVSAQESVGDFPSDTSDCDVAVVGGGPGGVYTAYRLLEGNSSMSVCLFEATARVGGRIFSVRHLGPRKDLVLDMGAYRYMPLTQPLITDIIESLLKLPHRLYQPGVPDYEVVLTEDGSNAGFQLWVETLLEMAIDMGLQMDYSTEITKLTPTSEGGMMLTTSAGRNITAGQVILNLPTKPLYRLLQASKLPTTDPVNYAINSVYQNRATKLYLYYDNAWWLANNLNNGSLAYNRPWNVTAPGAPLVPIIGRYHDGHTKCMAMTSEGAVAASSVDEPMYVDYFYENTNSFDAQNCYGYIQATYTSDAGATNISHYPLDYLTDYSHPSADNLPYTVWDNTTSMGRKLLTDAHTQIMEYLQTQNIVNVTQSNAASVLPTEAVVTVWDPSVRWAGGGWHTNKTVNASEPEVVQTAIKPFASLPLYVADEAYSTVYGWAEGSLVMAENIVRTYFDIGVPSWMQENTATVVMYETYNDFEDVQQGTGTVTTVGNEVSGPSPSNSMSAMGSG